MRSIARMPLLASCLVLCSFILFRRDKITVYLIGDSTVCTQPVSQAPVTGWGTPFAAFFDETVTVENHARGGRSTRTFISENRWQPIEAALKPGDYVFMQFGHNDEAKEEQYKDRYTTPEDYRKNLIRFITETRAKSAFPVLVTPVSRRRFSKEGKAQETHIEYSKIVAEVAAAHQVPLIDLDTKSRVLFDSLGLDYSKLLFNISEAGANPQFPDGVNDNTHFSEYGARLMAQLVYAEMRHLKLELLKRTVNGANATVYELYKDANRTADERAKDLLWRLTLEEKVSMTLNNSPAIPRLGIPAVEWWNEALHGVGRAGKATVFPQTIGMAASFNTPAILQTFTMVSDEARAKHHYFKSQNSFKRYQGLTFWTPNINIFRDPRWGRGQETYGEDPYLTTQMGMAVVLGLQGDSTARYHKLHACAKHYAVHSGPEWNRHSFDPHRMSARNLWETYLPAFKALVKDAGVKEVMCAYNRYDGEPCCSNKELLIKILRKDWGFDDVIVSDCGAIDDFYRAKAHETHASAAAASADAVRSGTDLCCGSTYRSLVEAVNQGMLHPAELDTSVYRLLRARFQLGAFDADSLVSWSSIPYSVVESKEHVQQALQMARESIVLLKNKNNALPLRKQAKVVVLGPNANDSVALWGNYNGFPTKTVTILEGIRAKLPAANVRYAKACDYVGDDVLESRIGECSIDGKPGFKASFYNTNNFTGPVVATHQMASDFNFDSGGNTVFAPGVNLKNFSARFETVLTPARSGNITFRIKADDGFRLLIDGKEVLNYKRTGSLKEQQYVLPAQQGKALPVVLEYFQLEGEASLRFDLGDAGKLNYAALAAKYKDADAIVFVGGISPKLEGEQMAVDLPGFKGGDRTKLELPDVQLNMLKALKATGKPVIFVICSGSSLALPWESEQLDGIVEAWYPGQQGGTAVADVLFGDYNPAGRLPLTFYRATEDLPDYEDYDMTKGRTYRYFKGKALYPFGYGLSYTTFSYGVAKTDRTAIPAGSAMRLTIPVKNAGKRSGEEVVQVYLVNKQDPQGPARSLRAFRRIPVAAGSTASITFDLPASTFEFFNPATEQMEIRPGSYDILYGGSSDLKALRSLTVRVE